MRRGLRVLLVVLLTADVPEVRLHGLFAAGGVALSEEVRLVGRDLHQVLAAQTHCCSDFREARTSGELFRLRRGRTVVLTYHVDAGAIRVGGSRYAVRSQQRVSVRAVQLTLFRTRTQEAGYKIDTLSPLYFAIVVCVSWLYLNKQTILYRASLFSSFCASPRGTSPT